MSSAADDRNILGKRAKRRARMGKEALREALGDADAKCGRRLQQEIVAYSKAAIVLRQQRDAAHEANQILSDAQPLLADLAGRWMRAGFFHRVWYAMAYVFKGSGAFRSASKGGSK